MKDNSLKKLFSSANKAVLFLGLTQCLAVFGYEKQFEIHVRIDGKIKTESRTLRDLVGQSSFEGEYFKIVEGSGQEAIRFDHQDPTVVKRAATVYYNMSMTRDYFDRVELPSSSGLRKQMVIRIDQEQSYSDVFHFDPRPEMNKYNASVIIPPSDPQMIESNVTPWGYEIWFRKAKVQSRNSPMTYLSRNINNRDFKNMLMGQMLYTDMVSITQGVIIQGSISQALSSITSQWQDHLISMAFSIGLSELIPQTLGLIGKAAKQRYYLDSALIPEIPVHEFAHIALSPVFGLKKSTALNEGFANYYAFKITGLKKLSAHARKHNLSDAPKSALNRAKYSFDQEMLKQAAYGSFTFSLLYQLDQALGLEGEKILTRSLYYLNSDSGLKYGLTEAVKRAILDVGSNPIAQWYAAQAVFLERGL